MRLPTWTAVLTIMALAAGCNDTKGDDTAGSSAGKATVQQVCQRAMDCDFGWADQATCEEGWIDNPDYQTECVSAHDYFACMPACLDLDCAAFTACEAECWDSAC